MSRPIPLTAQSRVLVIAPHPDDESLGCGGLIQQTREAGGAVRVVFVTDGDNNPWPQRVMEQRLVIGPAQRRAWGTRRRGEAIAAIQRLGLDRNAAVFFGLPDQGLTGQLLSGDPTFRRRLREEIDTFAPTLIASPAIHDHHSDHSAIAVLVRLTLRESATPPELIEYLIHGPTDAEHEDAWTLSLSPEQMAAKREATLCHRTQTLLSRGRFLAYTTAVETYCNPTKDYAAHAVERLERNGTHWQIDLCTRRWFDRLSAAQLELIACEGPMIAARRRVVLSGRSNGHRKLTIVDGESELAIDTAEYDGNGRLLLPIDSLPAVSTIYFKRQGGIAFFDEGGWKEIATRI